MAPSSWTALDLEAVVLSFLLFPLVLLIPGYVAAWGCNLLQFRDRSLLARLAIAIATSIGICPIVTCLLWQFLPPGLFLFYGGSTIAFAALAFRERRIWLSGFTSEIVANRAYLAIVLGWIALSILALIDLQVGRRLYFPTVAYDYTTRAAFTAAIARAGIPPHNPYFFPSRFFALRYHYFWFVLPAVVQQIAQHTVQPVTGIRIDARQAMIAETVWSGLGLLAIVPLYLRFFGAPRPRLKRQMLIGAGLLAVTGLDIIPVLAIEKLFGSFLASIESWNEPISGWVDAVLWVPHHVASLVACLMGFLLLWNAAQSAATRSRCAAAVLAAFMFAGALGTSIYVTFVFALFLFVWMVVAFLNGQRRHAGLILLSGCIALVVSLPWLHETFGPGAGAASGNSIMFAVRRFKLMDNILGLNQPNLRSNLVNLIALPLNYFLELGAFLIFGVIQCARLWRRRHRLFPVDLCSIAMLATSVFVCTFFRSVVIAGNDLGWRGFMPAQFVLLLWGVGLLGNGLFSKAGSRSFLILATLVLGVVGSAYEVSKIRFFPMLWDNDSASIDKWMAPDRNLGARTYGLRALLARLQDLTPPGAVFQHNPDVEPADLFHGMYADRQLAAESLTCGVVFGGSADLCSQRIDTIAALFKDSPAYDASAIDDTCRRLSIDVLVVEDTDKVWRDPSSWVWKRQPLAANDFGRAFACGALSR